MTLDTVKAVVPALFIGLGLRWMLASAVMLVRQRRKDRQWQRETRIQQRVSELLQEEYEQLLTPEQRQRWEAQRQHLAELRARAEAELAAEDPHRGRR